MQRKTFFFDEANERRLKQGTASVKMAVTTKKLGTSFSHGCVMYIFGMLLIVISAVLFTTVVLIDAIAYHTEGVITDAVITDCSIFEAFRRKRVTHYATRIDFTYNVDGQSYSSSHSNLNERFAPWENISCTEFGPNALVQIEYLASDAAQSRVTDDRINPHPNQIPDAIPMIAAAGVSIILLLFVRIEFFKQSFVALRDAIKLPLFGRVLTGEIMGAKRLWADDKNRNDRFKIAYRFKNPAGEIVKELYTERVPDATRALPEPRTRVKVLYVDNKTFVLL